MQLCSCCVFTTQRLKLIITKWCELQHGREIQNNIKLLAIKVHRAIENTFFPLSN